MTQYSLSLRLFTHHKKRENKRGALYTTNRMM